MISILIIAILSFVLGTLIGMFLVVLCQAGSERDCIYSSLTLIPIEAGEPRLNSQCLIQTKEDGNHLLLAEYADDGYVPELILDGDAAVPDSLEVVFGPYTGSFVPVYGAVADPDMDSANLAPPDSFKSYEALLSDGSYLSTAFGDAPELELPVTVYRISDYEYSFDQSATNPTLNVSFEMDSEKTAVLTWGFNGGHNNWEDGFFQRSIGGIKLRPNAAPGNQSPADGYLIFVGEDIESYSIQGYKNGSCKAGEKLRDLGCAVTRYETTFGDVLQQLLSESFPEEAEGLYSLTAETLLTVGPLSEDGIARYSEGMLDSIVYDLRHHSRIAYLCFSIDIPAGESMEVVLKTDKPASYNYYGAGGDTSLYGFEFATGLGSELEFITQEARISDFEGIEIVSQNFGFDPEAGISWVELDTDTPNYYLNIRKKTSE